MSKFNARNERIKHKYFAYLRRVRQNSEATIDAVAKSISRFETYTHWRDFKKFRHQQADAFVAHLDEQIGARSGAPLSKSTAYSALRALRQFFRWLAEQSGYTSLNSTDADYFNVSEKDARIATARREGPTPSVAQIQQVLSVMPTATDIDRRNRAVVACALLTGARDRALASLKLKHVDVPGRRICQDAREVETKFSKTMVTVFFPVPSDIRAIVTEWIRYLREEKDFCENDPLFPATDVRQNDLKHFQPVGLLRRHWSSAAPIRDIFRAAFAAAGLPYFNPHSFRRTLAQIAMKRMMTPEKLKAWSENLGHENIQTTLASYTTVSLDRRAEILAEMADFDETEETAEENQALEAIRKLLKRAKGHN